MQKVCFIVLSLCVALVLIGFISPEWASNAEGKEDEPRTITDIKPPFTFTIRTITPEGKPQGHVRIRCKHPRPERTEPLVDTVIASDEKGLAVLNITRADLVTDIYYWFSIADEGFSGKGDGAGKDGCGISPIRNEFTLKITVLPAEKAGPLENSRSPRNQVGGTSITGKIVDRLDKPIEGVYVTAWKYGLDPDERKLKAVTDSGGKFIIENASDGEWEIVAWSQKSAKQLYFAGPVKTIVREGLETKPFEITAREAFRVKGRFVTKYNINMTGYGGLGKIMLSTFFPNGQGDLLWSRQVDDGRSFDFCLPADVEGSILFQDVEGFYRITKIPREYPFLKASGSGLWYKNVPPNTYDGIEVHYLLSGWVRGSVVDSSGHPLPNLAAAVSPGGTECKIDVKGRFVCEAPPLESMRLYVSEEVKGFQSKPNSMTIFTSEAFNVREGEVIKKDIIIRKAVEIGDQSSLVGKSMPSLEGFKIDLMQDQTEDRSILVCFFDMNQRPSRNCITQLAKQAEQLTQKGVTVVAIQILKIDQNALSEWIKKYNISFPVGMVQGDAEKTCFNWGVQSLPWLILTDSKHIVRAEGFGLDELEKKIGENENVEK
jgi:hypothetical protein